MDDTVIFDKCLCLYEDIVREHNPVFECNDLLQTFKSVFGKIQSDPCNADVIPWSIDSVNVIRLHLRRFVNKWCNSNANPNETIYHIVRLMTCRNIMKNVALIMINRTDANYPQHDYVKKFYLHKEDTMVDKLLKEKYDGITCYDIDMKSKAFGLALHLISVSRLQNRFPKKFMSLQIQVVVPQYTMMFKYVNDLSLEVKKMVVAGINLFASVCKELGIKSSKQFLMLCDNFRSKVQQSLHTENDPLYTAAIDFQKECCVCLETLVEKSTVLMACCTTSKAGPFHCICTDCWKDVKQTCPMCRKRTEGFTDSFGFLMYLNLL